MVQSLFWQEVETYFELGLQWFQNVIHTLNSNDSNLIVTIQTRCIGTYCSQIIYATPI